MKTKELQGKSETELEHLLSEKRLELAKLQLQVSTKQLKNVRQVRAAKKTVAKILTLINK